MKLCFATNNAHKIEEISRLLQGKVEIVSLKEVGCTEELPETGNTIEANSLQKASYVFEKYGVPCFADDSGLEVAALEGRPGVNSAHYSGTRNDAANIAKVLVDLENTGGKNREAQFKTVITLASEKVSYQFEGIIKGEITTEYKGNSGFGYDPIFRPEGYSLTFAEMDINEKNKISHRARAVAKFLDFLNDNF